MTIHKLFLLAAALLLPATALAGTLNRIPLTAPVTKVTVYQDRALTVRSASTQLKPGSQLLVVEGLPVLLQDDSVRVEGSGTARVVVSGIEVKRAFLPQTAEKRVLELEEEIKGLEKKVGSLDSRKAGLLAQKNFLESIRVAWGDRLSKELAIGRPTSAELLDAMGFIGNGVARTDDQGREIEQEKKQLKDRIDALKRQKNDTTGSTRKESKSVEVMVEVQKEGNFRLEISGVVMQAGWVPGYDVRLAADGKTADLTYRAMVRQQTGEDWKNVTLTLSTARPASGGAPPELTPWQISFYRPMPMAMPAAPAKAYYENRLKKSKMMDMDEERAEAAAPEELKEAVFQTASVSTETTSVSFNIPKPVEISSDGSQHSTMIAIEKLPVTTEYSTVPKLSQAVYLTAELVNSSAWPLLPGQIKIFTGGTFIGSATMKKVAVGEKFSLPFGIDDQITIKRDEQKQHKEAGLFGKNRMGYRYRLELNNFRKEPQSITIKDQLPLAGDNEIKVSLEEAGLLPNEKKADGTLIWKLKLTPGEKKEFSYEIVVEYPKDKEISGL